MLAEKLTAKDIAAVLEIERDCFPSPLADEDFRQFARDGLSFTSRVDGNIVGYVVGEKVLDEYHIVRIAVAPKFRRRGIGAELIKRLLDEARGSGIKKIYLEARKSNEASRRLYGKAGFAEVYVRKGYYADNGEDAVFMEKRLGFSQEN
jgi:ribosomal-protein-alanine N-acetyltransferase